MRKTKVQFIGAAAVLLVAVIGSRAQAHEDPAMLHPHNAYGGHIAAPADSGVPARQVDVQVRCWTSCYSDGLSRNHRDYMAWHPSPRGPYSHSPRRVVTRSYVQEDYSAAHFGNGERRRGRWDGVARVGFLAGGAALGDEIHGKGVAGEVFGALMGNALFDAISR